MKKAVMICVVPFLLLAVLFCSSMLLPTQLSYPFETIQGDVSTLDSIGYEAIFATINQDYVQNRSELKIINTKGRTTIKKKFHNSFTDNNALTIRLNSRINTYVKNEDDDNKDYGQVYMNDTCKDVQEEVATLPIDYTVMYEYNDYAYGEVLPHKKDTNHYEPLRIHTSLYYETSDNQKLSVTKTICNGDEEVDNSLTDMDGNRELTTWDDDVNDSSVSVKYKDNEFYFMPATTKAMSGQNKIFRIDLIGKADESKNISGKVTEIVKLPEGYTYDRLIVDKDTFYILANAEDGCYLMCYGIDGTFLGKNRIVDQKIISAYAKIDQSYLLLASQQQIYVFDLVSKQVILQRENLENDSTCYYTIHDVLYQNDKLYILYYHELYDKKAKSFNGGMLLKHANIIVQVVKDHELIFEGKQSLYGHENELLDSSIYVRSLKFESEGSA